MDFPKFRRTIILYTGIFLIFLAIILLSYFRLLDNYELETFDIRFKLRPQIPIDKNIAIIEIGDDTIDKIGRWPLSRQFHATLVEALQEAGVKAIVFDIFFTEESDQESDRLFQEAIEKSGRVYLPHILNKPEIALRDVPRADGVQEEVIDKFKPHAKGIGFINIITDTDGKFRRIPPFIRYNNILYPHLSFLVGADYLGFKKDEIKVAPGRFVALGDELKVPLDSNSTIIVNFPGKWKDTFRHYSYIDIIDSYVSKKFPKLTGRKPIVDLEALRGSICLVGITATGTPDAHPIPLESLYPGVGVNASLLNSILTERFIRRADRFTNIIVLLFLCLITYLISKRTRTLFGFLLVFIFILGYIGLAAALFLIGSLWLDIFCPVTVILLVYVGLTFTKYITETHKIEILEKELGIAKRIQESFLPKESPNIPGIDIAAKMLTAHQVGGDLYDFIKMGDRRLGIMIGDVAGKGVPAALYMAKVVSEFKSYAGEELASQAMLKLNQRLCSETGSGLFVTLSYVIFDINTGFLSYSNGGHPPMIMVKASAAEPHLIDLKEGMPLGLFDGIFSEERIKFEKGDIFIFYTDGVTEATNPRAEMFGQERLVSLVKQNINLNARELVNLIQSEVKKFEGRRKQHDDITVIAVRSV